MELNHQKGSNRLYLHNFRCGKIYETAVFSTIDDRRHPAYPQSRILQLQDKKRHYRPDRVDEKFVWEGFRRGAPVVLVSGCHIGDCHYIDANHWTEKRVKRIHKKMEKMGIRAERLQLEWISAAEGIRFADKMKEMEKIRRTVTSAEIEETIELLRKI